MEAETYSYRTIFRPGDNEFVGYCAEFPELSAFALDEKAAMRGIEDLVANAVSNMQAKGEEAPKPFPWRLWENESASGSNSPEELREQEEMVGDGDVLDVEAIDPATREVL